MVASKARALVSREVSACSAMSLARSVCPALVASSVALATGADASATLAPGLVATGAAAGAAVAAVRPSTLLEVWVRSSVVVTATTAGAGLPLDGSLALLAADDADVVAAAGVAAGCDALAALWVG
jgi:hypothetical protein